MQSYYRNVALWLVQRLSMLTAATWGVLTGSSPEEFDRAMGAWEIGASVVHVLSRTASGCILHELVSTTLASSAGGMDRDGPGWSVLPEEAVNTAIVGGIGKSLLPLAKDYRDGRAKGHRTFLDADAIRSRAETGVEEGARLLKDVLATSAATMKALGERAETDFRPPGGAMPVPVEVARLRIVAGRLQIPDAADLALAGGSFRFTIRVHMDEFLIATETFDVPEPRVDARGLIVELERELAELSAQSGERLRIEVLFGAWESDRPGAEPVRFDKTHRGDPTSWLGSHGPEREQAWRLWYRVELVEGSKALGGHFRAPHPVDTTPPEKGVTV